mmetsp:Transcript_37882/g.82615  ORF Transcript_37882/g.82615 Transcript_37882/m.82615 type:complete len:230 (-) Transcript_37882:117-806(-)
MRPPCGLPQHPMDEVPADAQRDRVRNPLSARDRIQGVSGLSLPDKEVQHEHGQGEDVEGVRRRGEVHLSATAIGALTHLPWQPIVAAPLLLGLAPASEGLHRLVGVHLLAILRADHDAQVQDLQPAKAICRFPCHEVHVATSEVAVDEAEAGEVLQGPRSLGDDHALLRYRERGGLLMHRGSPLSVDGRLQRLAPHQLHNDVGLSRQQRTVPVPIEVRRLIDLALCIEF